MCIRVPRLGIKCKVVTAKPSSREPGCVPDCPKFPCSTMCKHTCCGWTDYPARLGIWLGCNQDVAPAMLTIHTLIVNSWKSVHAGSIYFTWARAQLYGVKDAWTQSCSAFVASQLSPHIYNLKVCKCIHKT